MVKTANDDPADAVLYRISLALIKDSGEKMYRSTEEQLAKLADNKLLHVMQLQTITIGWSVRTKLYREWI